jgi:hypothetical protein
MRNSYIDYVAPTRRLAKNAVVFKLNMFDLDRETFRLRQQLELSRLAAERLEEGYLNDFVFKPLQAGIDYAQQSLADSQDILKETNNWFNVGVLTRADVGRATADVFDKQSLLGRAQIDLIQRQIEVDGQKRRLSAQQTDINERIALNGKLSDISQYLMPADGTVEWHTYLGAFVEKADPICTITL